MLSFGWYRCSEMVTSAVKNSHIFIMEKKSNETEISRRYAEIPRRQLRMLQYENRQSKGVLDYFLVSKNCVSCDLKTDDLLCNACKIDPLAFIRLQREADVLSRKVYEMSKVVFDYFFYLSRHSSY